MADQLGKALVMGDDDELEVLLRLPVLHDPGETTRGGQNRRQQPAVGIKEPEQVFVLTALLTGSLRASNTGTCLGFVPFN